MHIRWIIHLLPIICALCLCRTSAAQPRPYSAAAPLVDTLRALVVFVAFSDDDTPGDPALDGRGWPLGADRGRLPAFAHTLLSPAAEHPYADSTLTAYFHRQSNGAFVLFGEPYDSVLVSSRPEAAYLQPHGGLGDLTVELLQRIDGYGFDFGRYDRNGDGAIDHVFVVLRGSAARDAKRFVWTGASCLDGRCAGRYTASPAREPLLLDGKRLDWDTSGSYILHRTPGNIIPQMYHVRLMAHEIGHDLWAPFFVHLPVLSGNDVPASSNRSPHGHCVGYALMAGAGGAWDCGGNLTISAFERDLLGWIDCHPLTASRDDLALPDLYASGACFTVPLDDAGRRTLYLTNHQRIDAFDRPRRGGVDGSFEMGLLRTTGVLAAVAQGNRMDILPADNTLDLGVTDAVYEGDLFAPATARQLTPWTRPNSNGYTRYPAGAEVRWHAIDAIRVDPATHEARFDFLADARARPIMRTDAWMGDETRGTRFEADLRIEERSTLHVATTIVAGRALDVAPGSTLHIGPEGRVVIAPEGRLHLSPGSAIVLEGDLVLQGPMYQALGATVHRRGAGRIVADVTAPTAHPR